MRKFMDIVAHAHTRKHYRVDEDFPQPQITSVQRIENFIEELNPSDVGGDMIDPDTLIKYEGFGEECWDDVEEKGKSPDDLEAEILAQWRAENPEFFMDDHGWLDDPQPHSDNVFWAVFRRLRARPY